jgi:hypothetical protein
MKKRKPSATRRKKKYKGNPLASAAATLIRRVVPRMFTRSFLLVLIVVLGLLTIEWVAGQAGENPRFTVHPDSLKCLSRPQWLATSDRITSEIMGSIQEEISRFPPEAIFSDTIEEAFKTRLNDFSPWIESVRTFQRIYPSRYRVELKLRKPVALFLDRSRSYFIDAAGVVIASVDQLDRGKVKAALPLVTGFGDLGHVVEGQHTRNRRLIEGAAVAKEIEVFQALEPLQAIRVVEIDVSAFGSNKPDGVTLYTAQNVRILWGRSARNTRFRGIDPSPLEKARSLEQVVRRNPGLRGVDTVTVTFRNSKPTFTRRGDEL